MTLPGQPVPAGQGCPSPFAPLMSGRRNGLSTQMTAAGRTSTPPPPASYGETAPQDTAPGTTAGTCPGPERQGIRSGRTSRATRPTSSLHEAASTVTRPATRIPAPPRPAPHEAAASGNAAGTAGPRQPAPTTQTCPRPETPRSRRGWTSRATRPASSLHEGTSSASRRRTYGGIRPCPFRPLATMMRPVRGNAARPAGHASPAWPGEARAMNHRRRGTKPAGALSQGPAAPPFQAALPYREGMPGAPCGRPSLPIPRPARRSRRTVPGRARRGLVGRPEGVSRLPRKNGTGAAERRSVPRGSASARAATARSGGGGPALRAMSEWPRGAKDDPVAGRAQAPRPPHGRACPMQRPSRSLRAPQRHAQGDTPIPATRRAA